MAKMQKADEYLPLVYGELRRIAARQMAGEAPGRTLQPTALVHEAWLRLHAGAEVEWKDRLHFTRGVVRTMRRILVDEARKRKALCHADEALRVSLDESCVTAPGAEAGILAVDTALAILKEEDEESARLVELKFFGGFTNKEVAQMERIPERSLERRWSYAKARIFQIMQQQGGRA